MWYSWCIFYAPHGMGIYKKDLQITSPCLSKVFRTADVWWVQVRAVCLQVSTRSVFYPFLIGSAFYLHTPLVAVFGSYFVKCLLKSNFLLHLSHLNIGDFADLNCTLWLLVRFVPRGYILFIANIYGSSHKYSVYIYE